MNCSLEMAQALSCFDVISFLQLYKEVNQNFSLKASYTILYVIKIDNTVRCYLGMVRVL